MLIHTAIYEAALTAFLYRLDTQGMDLAKQGVVVLTPDGRSLATHHPDQSFPAPGMTELASASFSQTFFRPFERVQGEDIPKLAVPRIPMSGSDPLVSAQVLGDQLITILPTALAKTLLLEAGVGDHEFNARALPLGTVAKRGISRDRIALAGQLPHGEIVVLLNGIKPMSDPEVLQPFHDQFLRDLSLILD